MLGSNLFWLRSFIAATASRIVSAICVVADCTVGACNRRGVDVGGGVGKDGDAQTSKAVEILN